MRFCSELYEYGIRIMHIGPLLDPKFVLRRSLVIYDRDCPCVLQQKSAFF